VFLPSCGQQATPLLFAGFGSAGTITLPGETEAGHCGDATMLRDNLAGLIEPMIDRAGVHPLGGHPKEGGGCSRSTDLAIVALKRSRRQIFHWKTGRRAENRKWHGFAVTTAAHDSRAVGTAQHQSHRTIDPQCLENPRPEGAESTLTENAASPFQAEPTKRAPRHPDSTM
jgi:hypothetical protein